MSTPKQKSTRKKIIIAVMVGVSCALLIVSILKNKDMLVGKQSSEIAKLGQLVEKLQKQNEEMEAKMERQREAFEKAGTGTSLGSGKINVVVAAENLTPGKKLTEADLKLVEADVKELPEGYSKSLNSLVGKVLTASILKGQVINESNILQGSAADLNLAPGFRAMSIKVDNITGVAGHVSTGSRVDVMAILPKNNDEAAEKVAKVLLQNVEVIDSSSESAIGEAGKATTSKVRRGSTSSSNIVTLAVPAEEIGKIALVMDKAPIHLVLRSVGDNTKIGRTLINTADLISGKSAKKKKASADIDLPPPPSKNVDVNDILANSPGQKFPKLDNMAPATKNVTVEVIEANNRSELSFETGL